MKIFILVCLLVGITAVYGQTCSNGTIWSQLGVDDAARAAAVGFVTDRAFGLLLGNECLGHLFRSSPSNLRIQFVRFLCTVFGGNPGGINDNNTNIGYRIHDLPANPYIPSENVTDLLAALSVVHQPLGFSQPEQNAFKAAVAAVLTSAGLPACLVTLAGNLLTATDSSIVAGAGTLNTACQTASQSIQWRNPVTQSASVSVNQSVCFDWSDSLTHTVNDTNTPPLGIAGFGSGDGAAEAIAVNNASNCISRPSTAGACFLGASYRYCIKFFSAGTFTFNCGIHGSGMTATITVSATAGTTTTGSGGTTTTGSGGSTSSSAGASLRPSVIF